MIFQRRLNMVEVNRHRKLYAGKQREGSTLKGINNWKHRWCGEVKYSHCPVSRHEGCPRPLDTIQRKGEQK